MVGTLETSFARGIFCKSCLSRLPTDKRERIPKKRKEIQKKLFVYPRRLGDEMRSMSLEKNRQREAELLSEIEKLQSDIKVIQKSSEEGANVSHKLSKEVGFSSVAQ